MWVLYAFGSAFFAGLTSILAKCGIKKADSNVATAIRTMIVLIFSWIMVFVVGAQGQIRDVSEKTVDITPEITGSGKLKIDGLKEGTSYTATMKNSGKTISKITFDIPSKPAGAIEIE